MTVTRKLIVEGREDKHVILAILRTHGPLPSYEIEHAGGYTKLRKQLSVYLKPGTDLEHFGIIVDADASVENRWKSIRGALAQSKYKSLPVRHNPDGTIVEQTDLPRVGVWIMPDNRSPGAIEEYVSALVPEDDVLLQRAKACIAAIPADSRRFSDQHATKALIRTWIAWQKRPDMRLGNAVSAYIRKDGPEVLRFLAWLKRLFDVP